MGTFSVKWGVIRVQLFQNSLKKLHKNHIKANSRLEEPIAISDKHSGVRNVATQNHLTEMYEMSPDQSQLTIETLIFTNELF